MVSVKAIIALCAVAFFIGPVEATGGNAHNKPSCEKKLFNSYCEFKQLVLTKKDDKCIRARDVLNEAVSDCVAEDPVKRMVQSIQYVQIFAPNCKNVKLPSDECSDLPRCLQMLFDTSGRIIRW
ncbi:hypothetical protein EB796_006155 [Bugula neritina]|uniref:Uncharacterized protein n=1 Tax=Bugula neritina TaxID=10212 RepID=A0A7J7KBA4_BUGNE|nr:hypothetical protein EB796_006155 [Bugula neritina]